MFITAKIAILVVMFVLLLRAALGPTVFDRILAINTFEKIPRFLPWYFLEVIKSNLDVSWRILHPKLPIKPNISTVPISQHSEVGKTVYANCITLTPGTYSMDISPNSIKVHSLTKEHADNLQQGEMDKRILALEVNPHRQAID